MILEFLVHIASRDRYAPDNYIAHRPNHAPMPRKRARPVAPVPAMWVQKLSIQSRAFCFSPSRSSIFRAWPPPVLLPRFIKWFIRIGAHDWQRPFSTASPQTSGNDSLKYEPLKGSLSQPLNSSNLSTILTQRKWRTNTISTLVLVVRRKSLCYL